MNDVFETPQDIVERIKRDGHYSVPVQAGEGLDYEQRELLKREACAMLASDEPIPGRAWALLHLIEAHYWRAKSALENRPKRDQHRILGRRYTPGYELDIDVYTRHWLAANGANVSEQDVVHYVIEHFHYEPEESQFLPPGHSVYVIPDR